MRLRMVLLYTCIVFVSCHLKFDKRRWQTKDVHYVYRSRMVDDLIKRYDLLGMKYDEVIGLLGAPDYIGSRYISYEIDVDYGTDIDPVRGENMILTMSADSFITRLEIEKWDNN